MDINVSVMTESDRVVIFMLRVFSKIVLTGESEVCKLKFGGKVVVDRTLNLTVL